MSVPPGAPTLLPLPGLDPTLVRAAVTTRAGGVSVGGFASLNLGFHVGDEAAAVLTNRERAADAFGAPLGDCIFAEQVAGTRVQVVTAADRGRGARSRTDAVAQTDALVTDDPNPVLVLMAADCMLIALFDPTRPALALIHAGWPGTTKGVIPAAVDAMREIGADPGRIVASIGPAVSAEAYQVGEDVADAVHLAFADRAARVLRPDGTGRYLFDLPAAATVQLVDAGLDPRRVHRFAGTTGPGTPFFSHRFEGPTGRFAVLAQLTGKTAA